MNVVDKVTVIENCELDLSYCKEISPEGLHQRGEGKMDCWYWFNVFT